MPRPGPVCVWPFLHWHPSVAPNARTLRWASDDPVGDRGAQHLTVALFVGPGGSDRDNLPNGMTLEGSDQPIRSLRPEPRGRAGAYSIPQTRGAGELVVWARPRVTDAPPPPPLTRVDQGSQRSLLSIAGRPTRVGSMRFYAMEPPDQPPALFCRWTYELDVLGDPELFLGTARVGDDDRALRWVEARIPRANEAQRAAHRQRWLGPNDHDAPLPEPWLLETSLAPLADADLLWAGRTARDFVRTDGDAPYLLGGLWSTGGDPRHWWVPIDTGTIDDLDGLPTVVRLRHQVAALRRTLNEPGCLGDALEAERRRLDGLVDALSAGIAALPREDDFR